MNECYGFRFRAKERHAAGNGCGVLAVAEHAASATKPDAARESGGGQWQSDLQQPTDFGDAQLGRFRVRLVLPPPLLGGWRPAKRELSSRA